MNNKLPPGRYYVGDLCYYIPNAQWQDFLDNGYKWKDGVDTYNDVPFAMFSTAYGDGSYYGTDGNEYAVDSGTIGCFKLSDGGPLGPFDDSNLAQIVEFTEPFSCDVGVIRFGDLYINTDPDTEDEEYLEEYDYYEEENE